MMISDFTVICDDCGQKYRIQPDSLDVSYAYSERPMGTEVQHIFYGEMVLPMWEQVDIYSYSC